MASMNFMGVRTGKTSECPVPHLTGKNLIEPVPE